MNFVYAPVPDVQESPPWRQIRNLDKTRLSHEKTPVAHALAWHSPEWFFLIGKKVSSRTLNLNQARGKITEADSIRPLTSGNSGYKAIMKRHLETVVLQKAASNLANLIVR